MIEKTKEETLLRVATLTIILRDDLEEIEFDKTLKNKANMFLKELNKNATFLASDSEETNNQLMNIVKVFDERLQLTPKTCMRSSEEVLKAITTIENNNNLTFGYRQDTIDTLRWVMGGEEFDGLDGN